jgi:hypothetical protein
MSHFDFDLFISYGWAGLDTETDGDRGWVRRLRDVLQNELSANLGRRARIFLDVEQPGNGRLTANLERAIESSALFLFLLSPGSCKKESWCRLELNHFLRHSTPAVFSLRQVMTALLRDIEGETEDGRDKWPEPLQNASPYFFVDKKHPDRLQLAAPDPSNLKEGSGPTVCRMAKHLRRMLKEQQEEISKTVFLADVSPAQQKNVDRLRMEITGRTDTALQGRRQPDETEAMFAERSRRWLMGSTVSVHLIDESSGIIPEGWTDAPQFIQLQNAGRRFDREKGMIVQRDSGPAAAGITSFVSNAQLLDGGRFEYLDSVLRDLMRAKAEATAGFRRKRDPDQQYVFIDCVRRDIKYVITNLRPAFARKEIQIKARLFRGPEDLRRANDRECLKFCDGAAVFFGSRSDLDTSDTCRWLCESTSERNLPKAVIIKPHTDPERSIFVYPHFKNYPAHELDEFIDQIVARRHAAAAAGQGGE